MDDKRDPKYWRERAEKIMVQAKAMDDPEARDTMLELAASCTHMAEVEQQEQKERRKRKLS